MSESPRNTSSLERNRYLGRFLTAPKIPVRHQTLCFDPGLRVSTDPPVRHRGPDISITAHGGIINAILAAAGRPSYSLPTGGTTAFSDNDVTG